MEPLSAVLFMSGIILTIDGTGRAIALRLGVGVVAGDDAGTQPIPIRVRSDVATLLWVAVALYGLFLASTAIAISR